jgi:hypothetical protein
VAERDLVCEKAASISGVGSAEHMHLKPWFAERYEG